MWLVVWMSCARSVVASSVVAAPLTDFARPIPHPAERPNGDYLYTAEGVPTGEIVLWPRREGDVVVVRARLQIGDLEHAWEIGRVAVGGETVLAIEIPPEGQMTSLQEFAMSTLYVSLDRLTGGEVDSQLLGQLSLVWTYGLDAPPVLYTMEDAIETWPGGIVGIVGPAGRDVSQPADAVRAWMEVNR